MFSSKQAALLFIQLLKMGSVCAVVEIDEHRELQVSRGDTVLLTCNGTETNVTMIKWTNGRFMFVHSITHKKTFSNFSLSRFKLYNETLATLCILNVQHDDAGLYTCSSTSVTGVNKVTWNLTITERQQGINLQHILLQSFITTGLLLVFIIAAVCFYRKCGTRKANLDPSQKQPQSQSERETGSTQLQGITDQWRNKSQRREYIERLNSIYGDDRVTV